MTHDPYRMRISRLIVDKLGVKLYDRVSAAVAELIANSYDADAETVDVTVPTGTLLGEGREYDEVVVEDDGHGMTPAEAVEFYLHVGTDRRSRKHGGDRSRDKKRPVMGRKGIGKLAPFGICKEIEVWSAGGEKSADGYLITHFTMHFEDIVKDTDEHVEFSAGEDDEGYCDQHGTRITLRRFTRKRVPDAATLCRQIARRFAVARDDLEITVHDERHGGSHEIEPFDVPMMPESSIDLASRPVAMEDGTEKSVLGVLGLAKDAYKNPEMTGVRIYSRGKIVATTRDFEQPAGYTGEFTTRSYLVGHVHADWLDEEEDLIRTDRQDIIWESSRGRALRQWGADLIKEIGAASRAPRRARVREMFLKNSDFERRAREAYNDTAVVETAVALAKQIGNLANEDELEDDDYLDSLSEVILSVAPHKALMEALKEFSSRALQKDIEFAEMGDLFGKSRVAEMASYSQIASERVQVIEQLENIIDQKPAAGEMALQKLITSAPWLIEPSWAIISANQSLKTFKRRFEKFFSDYTGEKTVLALGEFDESRKRPDFVLMSVGSMAHLIEIKKVGHAFDDEDYGRLAPYFDALDEFFKNVAIADLFPLGYRVDLVADAVALKNRTNARAFKGLVRSNQLVVRSWDDFLIRARMAHEAFLDARDESRNTEKKHK